MKTLDQPMYRKLGYSWGEANNRKQRSALQFADDAAIVAADNRCAQGLLNVYQAFCSGAFFSFRLDKCVAFSAMKRSGVYMQIAPVLNISAGLIPPVGPNGEFIYLGRRFSCDMNNSTAKQALVTKLHVLLNIINGLKVRAQSKLRILSQ